MPDNKHLEASAYVVPCCSTREFLVLKNNPIRIARIFFVLYIFQFGSKVTHFFHENRAECVGFLSLPLIIRTELST